MIMAALDYAERGFALVPNHDVAGGACSCEKGADCRSSGKHPRIGAWQRDATNDPDTVRQWWTRWPNANIGLLCGKATGFIVLDVDGAKGAASLAKCERKYGPLPRTVEARSASGGMHFHFVHPGGTVQNTVGFRPGMDIRADNGQILVSPSRTAKGEYRWIRHPEVCELADPPAWLMDLIQRRRAA